MKQGRFGQGNDGERVAEFVAHQHLRLDPVIVEGHHQTVSCYGSTTRPITGIHNQNSHGCNKLFTFRSSLFTLHFSLLLLGLLLTALLLLTGLFFTTLLFLASFLLLALLFLFKFLLALALFLL